MGAKHFGKSAMTGSNREPNPPAKIIQGNFIKFKLSYP